MTPKRVFIIMVSLLLLTIGIGAGAFYMADQSLAQRADIIKGLKAELDILDIQINNNRRSIAELENLRDVQESVNSVLPPDKIQSDVVGELLVLAEGNNINLTRIAFPSSGESTDFEKTQTQPLDGVPGVLFVQINLDSDASTPFSDVLSFLDALEANQRKLQVTNVSVTPAQPATPGDPPPDRYALTVQLNVYVRAQ